MRNHVGDPFCFDIIIDADPCGLQAVFLLIVYERLLRQRAGEDVHQLVTERSSLISTQPSPLSAGRSSVMSAVCSAAHCRLYSIGVQSAAHRRRRRRRIERADVSTRCSVKSCLHRLRCTSCVPPSRL
eukprot:m.112344 g.112344  ORF g.112344 m.112344 type:complete len:128 (+) comp15322_c0_seq2:90-473(+)